MGQNPGRSGIFHFSFKSQTIDIYPMCLMCVDRIDLGNCPLQEMDGNKIQQNLRLKVNSNNKSTILPFLQLEASRAYALTR